MASTILHNLRTAVRILEQQPDGNWPISPRLLDPTIMDQYDKDVNLSGERGVVLRYEELIEKLDIITSRKDGERLR